MSFIVRLKNDAFGKAARLAGLRSNYALAKKMEINRSTVARVICGDLNPGSAFIAGALHALSPMQFDDLFEIVGAHDPDVRDDERLPSVFQIRRGIRSTQRLPGWFTDRPERLLDVVRAEVSNGRGEKAVELLAEVWPLVADDVDDHVARRLHECGVYLTSVLPTSPLMARACRLGAIVLRARGLHRLAAAQGLVALAVHREHDDPDAVASALLDLAETYHADGRMHRAIVCVDEALEVYGPHQSSVGFARTLLLLGSIMIETGRYDSAVECLTQATSAHERLGNAVSSAEGRALLSRAHRLLGDDDAASRDLHHALALVGEADHAEVRRLREVSAGVRQFTPILA
ncbi:hypothetical protein ACFYOT_22035 [Saccharothrix saharensis]|uniref:hypothetical protein n=1 Tax=Saccharothrix saharensis TaxID=571190 RepID=UPI0036A42D42